MVGDDGGFGDVDDEFVGLAVSAEDEEGAARGKGGGGGEGQDGGFVGFVEADIVEGKGGEVERGRSYDGADS